MRVKIYVFLLGVSFYFPCSGQEKIVLEVTTDNNKVQTLDLQEAMAPAYYPSELTYESKATGTDSTFLFNGSIIEPYYCELLIDSTHFSGSFVLYPGKNALKILNVEGEMKIIKEDDHVKDNLFSLYSSWFTHDSHVHGFLRDNEKLIRSEKLRGIE
ncbi:MAG TPA: hypothetical protein VK102_11640 [Sphingobacterium sp.]|nr:hypothetical protein [Sphingobacterium sp.]